MLINQARGFCSAGKGRHELRIGEQVVEKWTDVLYALRPSQIEQEDADAGHAGNSLIKGLSVTPVHVMVVSEDGCMNLRNELVSLNTRLEVEGCRLRIEQRGQRLNLRGPLPRRDGQQGFSMQRISLGLKADVMGLQDAEQTLHDPCSSRQRLA